MTLFEKTIPKMSRDIQYPEAYAKEQFTHDNREAEHIISAISEDGGETICGRSLIMLLHQMSDRICELEYEIRKTQCRTGVTKMTNFSPETRAIVDAYEGTTDKYVALAAVLLALVNEVAPVDYDHWDGREGEYWSGVEYGQNRRNKDIRHKVLKIVKELKNI